MKDDKKEELFRLNQQIPVLMPEERADAIQRCEQIAQELLSPALVGKNIPDRISEMVLLFGREAVMNYLRCRIYESRLPYDGYYTGPEPYIEALQKYEGVTPHD